MGFDDICNTGLVLGLGFAATLKTSSSSKSIIEKPSTLMAIRNSFEAPSLTLGLSAESSYELQVAKNNKGNSSNCAVVVPNSAADLSPHSHSAISSFSNATSIKRERDAGSEEVEAERVSNLRVNNDDDEDCCNTRKKLRLTKQQSAILEDSFKQHTTLNPKQKQALARQLNLRPRQVEVWFQNRRARTKLKQTEVDCEFLKKCCETLTNENRRLQKEVQELKALKLAQPLYMQLPAATLSMCPSCERIAAGVGDVATNTPFALASKPHFYNPFTNPSAAC